MRTEYSFIEHLACAVLLSDYSAGTGVGMFKAATGYFDASGHQDDPHVMTVGGFISKIDKWKRFDRAWNSILEEHGLDALHMTDYARGVKPYQKFKGDATLRKRFQNQLSDCIAKNTNKAVRATLLLVDYNAVNRIFKLKEQMGPPYAVCGVMCLYEALQWARRKKCEKSLICFFEDGDKGRGELKKRAAWMFPVERLQFLQKDKIRAFEAADFMAWKAKKNVEKWMSDSYHPSQRHDLHKSMGSLEKIPTEAKIMTIDGLIGVCRFLGVEKR